MTTGADVQSVLLATVVVGIVGALLSRLGGSDPYREIGGGELALDVSDREAAPPLNSPAGQEELEQLKRALEGLRGRNEP
jgi:hypothetical protein